MVLKSFIRFIADYLTVWNDTMNLLHLARSSCGLAVPRAAMTRNCIHAASHSEGLNKAELVGGRGNREGQWERECGVARKEPGSMPAANTAGSEPDHRFSGVTAAAIINRQAGRKEVDKTQPQVSRQMTWGRRKPLLASAWKPGDVVFPSAAGGVHRLHQFRSGRRLLLRHRGRGLRLPPHRE